MRGPSTTDSSGSVVLRALWRARWLILCAVVVAGVGGYVVTASQQETYRAESEVVLSSTEEFDPLGRQSFGEATRYVANQLSVLFAPQVLDTAVEALDDGTTNIELAEAMDVSASADADVLTVTATASTAEAAAARANAVVDAYRGFVLDRVAARARAAEAATTDPVIIEEIRARAASYGDGVAVVQSAAVPDQAAGPNPARSALLLAVVAALLAGGIAVWRRGDGSAEVSLPEAIAAPVLATVPVRPRTGRRAGEPDAGRFALALVALRYAVEDRRGPVLLSGVSRHSGAPAVAEGLAVAAADAGLRVLVVDAEPGREVLGRLGAHPPQRTLDALADPSVAEGEVLVGVERPDRRGPALHVAVLGEDERPAPEAAVTRALGRLTGAFDLVLLHGGPVADSARAFSLLREAAVVVGVAGPDDAPAAVRLLRERVAAAGRPLAGAVVTQPAGRRRRPAPRAPSTAPAGARAAGPPVGAVAER
ncbi:hypothetical protein [Trujillonella humicola]|uniref:hypothetical protein n=1 Tax=Trujillonella humicola TaxID=3383699 RepID=UPI003906025D